MFDFDSDISKSSTIWAGVIGAICLSIAQGSTQGTWQRVKACRSVNDACKAFDAAAFFYVVHVLILGVGLALFAFYGERGVPESLAAQLMDAPDRIFPTLSPPNFLRAYRGYLSRQFLLQRFQP